MKCPYRKIIIKRPEMKANYTVKFAQDIEEFADCYEGQCFFWGDYKCHKAIADMRGGEECTKAQ